MSLKLYQKIEEHIKENELEVSPELMFVEFEKLVNIHDEFQKYLRKRKMNRNKSKLEKRKIFINWFVQTRQNRNHDNTVTSLLEELSDICFCSKRTIEREISDTTA